MPLSPVSPIGRLVWLLQLTNYGAWGLPRVGSVHLKFGEVGDVDGGVVGEEFDLGAVGAGGVDALDDTDS